MAVDAGGQIYATNFGGSGTSSVTVYPANANGNVAPTQFITGPNTDLFYVPGIAIDANDNIFVGGCNYDDCVNVFAAGSNGNVMPVKVEGEKSGIRALHGLAIE